MIAEIVYNVALVGGCIITLSFFTLLLIGFADLIFDGEISKKIKQWIRKA